MITTDGHKLKGGPVEALRQALAQPEQEYVIDCPRCGHCCPNVDAVNISQERVDETSKREHEPVAWFVQYEYRHEFLWRKPNELEQKTALEIKPLYTAPPISDYHEGWEEGFKAATREQEPFIYVREDNEKPFGGYEHCSEADTGAFPVYTAPPKREWVGLTDEEMRRLKQKSVDDGMTRVVSDFEYIRSIEAKLKEKNT